MRAKMWRFPTKEKCNQVQLWTFTTSEMSSEMDLHWYYIITTEEHVFIYFLWTWGQAEPVLLDKHMQALGQTHCQVKSNSGSFLTSAAEKCLHKYSSATWDI